ncbi:MAG: Uma2 family endonuclease [Planctomycetota bacterium]
MSTSLRLTPAEYDLMVSAGAFDRLNRRTEMIDGEICEMSPAGPIHDDYVQFLIQWSQRICFSNEAVLRVQSGVLVGASVPEPVLCLLKPARYFDRRVTAADSLLVIEVADSSLSFDLGEKASLYASGGVEDYWVIDVAASKLHRHREPTAATYRRIEVFGREDSLSPHHFPSAVLVLADLFITGPS